MSAPVLFLGHGSPMNIISDNTWTRNWSKLSENIERPKAILGISAHWYSDKTYISSQNPYRQIYDMVGFPKEIYEINYQAFNDEVLLGKVLNILEDQVTINNDWGLDHGLWSLLHFMYPKGDIPLVILSLDRFKSYRDHYQIGENLKELREEGYLILASGNMVHNLMMADWSNNSLTEFHRDFDNILVDKIINRDIEGLINIEDIENYQLAFTSPEHYLPLMYALGASSDNDQLEVFNQGGELGSVSMTSFIWK